MLKSIMFYFVIFLAILEAQEVSPYSEPPIELRGIKVWPKVSKIEVEGLVNMNEGLVELLATAPGGKEHESVLVLHCNPMLLQTSLLLIGLTPGGGGKEQGDSSSLYGDKIFIYVQWKEGEKDRLVRAERLVWDSKHNQQMNETKWAFTGSRIFKTHEGKKVFAANIYGVLVATYYDPDAIINNPLPERSDDTVYFANKQILPPKKTPVTIIFTTLALQEKAM